MRCHKDSGNYRPIVIVPLLRQSVGLTMSPFLWTEVPAPWAFTRWPPSGLTCIEGLWCYHLLQMELVLLETFNNNMHIRLIGFSELPNNEWD